MIKNILMQSYLFLRQIRIWNLIKSITYNVSGGKDYIHNHHGQDTEIVGIIFTCFFFNFRTGLEKQKRGLQAAFTIILWWPFQPQRRSS